MFRIKGWYHIDGKTYNLLNSYRLKSDARDAAERQRPNRKSVRVIKTGEMWSVYWR